MDHWPDYLRQRGIYNTLRESRHLPCGEIVTALILAPVEAIDYFMSNLSRQHSSGLSKSMSISINLKHQKDDLDVRHRVRGITRRCVEGLMCGVW